MALLSIREVCRRAPVIPVIVIDDLDKAVPLAEALVAGGLPALEVTLRTPVALQAIRAIADAVEGAVVGVGTLRTADDVKASIDAGARFGVSPGFTDAVIDAAEAEGLSMLPGVATPSEAMRAADRGFEILKFFPAEANGGVPVLKAWASPLAGLQFCPTGGVNEKNAKDYLNLSNVICVGGSWVTPKDVIEIGDWARVANLASDASGLQTL